MNFVTGCAFPSSHHLSLCNESVVCGTAGSTAGMTFWNCGQWLFLNLRDVLEMTPS